MKTFKWTVPELPLSEAEKEPRHNNFEEFLDQIGYQPKNGMERFFLKRVSNARSKVNLVWILAYLGFFTLLYHDHDQLWVMWLFLIFVGFQYLFEYTVRKILTEKYSEQTRAANSLHATRSTLG
jgi:cyanate permease